jgi:hypothetical protein
VSHRSDGTYQSHSSDVDGDIFSAFIDALTRLPQLNAPCAHKVWPSLTSCSALLIIATEPCCLFIISMDVILTLLCSLAQILRGVQQRRASGRMNCLFVPDVTVACAQ